MTHITTHDTTAGLRHKITHTAHVSIVAQDLGTTCKLGTMWLVPFCTVMWLLLGRCGQVVSPAAVYRQEISARTWPHYWWAPVLFCKLVMFTVRCELVSLLYRPFLPLYLSLSFGPSLTHSLFLSPSLPLSLSLFLRGGVWSTNDQHWWEADQATDLGHGKLLSLSSYTITPRDKPFHSPTKSTRCGEKWSSSDRLSDM